MTDKPRGAHLVGTIPLADGDTVFRTTASTLGHRLRRVTDGETGERLGWIEWQLAKLLQHPQFELLPQDVARYGPAPRVGLRDGVAAGDVRFEDLGYAAAARPSWALFSRLQRDGVLPETWRFQVSLPTPLAPINAFVDMKDKAAVEPAFEAAMHRELEEILDAVPSERLSLQWDTAVEFGLLEGTMPSYFGDPEPGILERLVRYGSWVPDGVELGYHLCYGDYNHKHFKEPDDTAKLVSVANGVAAGVDREIAFVHMPVPRARDDDAYFAPLADRKLHPETELYLGLVHHTDGVEGTNRRIATARRVVPSFGVATECGWGRRPPETVPRLLEIHAEVADDAG
jgi:hypothetical protein